MTEHDRPRRGRPRDEACGPNILEATLDVVAEVGLAGFTVEAVAQRAGVGKATIYRRWKGKEDLVAEALRSVAQTPRVPDTGSVRGDIAAGARAAVQRLSTDAFRVLPRLLAETGDDPELRAAVDDALLRPRREAFGVILRRGVERGELRDDVDVELVTDVLLGPILTTLITSGSEPKDLASLPVRVYDVLADGIGTGRRVG